MSKRKKDERKENKCLQAQECKGDDVMIRTWPGQTKEEWMRERERDRNLTPEERERELDEYIKQNNGRWEARKKREHDLRSQIQKSSFENCDHPNSLENSEATIIWVVVMAVATIFKGNWFIWIVATIIWRKYITRHKIKK